MKVFTSMFVIIAIFALPLSAKAKADLNVAVVDIQKVLEATKEGKRAKDMLNTQAAQRSKEIDELKEKLNKLEQDFSAKQLVLKGEVRAQKERELREKALELQKLMLNSEAEFKQKQVKMTDEIVKKISGVVTKLGVDKKFDFVLEKNSAIYFKSAYDVTGDVIALYDKLYK